VPPRCERGEQEERLGVRGTEEQCERIARKQQQGVARTRFVEHLARKSREIPRGPEERRQRNEQTTPGERDNLPLDGQPGSECADARPRCANEERIRRKEREVLLPVESILPFVSVGGDTRVPLRVPPRRQRAKRSAGGALLACRFRQSDREHSEKADQDDGRPRGPECDDGVIQRGAAPDLGKAGVDGRDY
jgi:hypothetical protein